MHRNLMMLAALLLFVCSIGCAGDPGPVVKGTATNADFGESGDVGPDGQKAPRGLGFID